MHAGSLQLNTMEALHQIRAGARTYFPPGTPPSMNMTCLRGVAESDQSRGYAASDGRSRESGRIPAVGKGSKTGSDGRISDGHSHRQRSHRSGRSIRCWGCPLPRRWRTPESLRFFPFRSATARRGSAPPTSSGGPSSAWP